MIAQFGSFVVDTEQRRLLRDATDVHLTPKAFDLLVVLIQGAPRVIPKTELHTRLWPDTFVSDATLVGLVKELRRGLHDSEGSEPVLRTVHGVGYAFSATLSVVADRQPVVPTCWIAVGSKRTPLADGEHIIGRDPHASVWIDAPNVSRQHARVRVDGTDATIEDLGSKNGTFVRDCQLREVTPLTDGDRIQIAMVLLVFRCSQAGASTETLVHRGRR